MARSPVAATLSHAAVAPANDSMNDPVALQASEMSTDGRRAKASRMKKRRPRNPTRFTVAPYGRRVTAVSWSNIQIVGTRYYPHTTMMKTHTDYLTFETKKRQEIIDITDAVERCRAAADIQEGMVLASAMHISASVFVNDHESGLWKDILDWLEGTIATWDPSRYRHNETGEDN